MKKAEQYKNKIPDYHISSGNCEFHTGVIEDNKNDLSNDDYNEPPPAFVKFPGNVAIDQNKINIAGFTEINSEQKEQKLFGYSNKQVENQDYCNSNVNQKCENQSYSGIKVQNASVPGTTSFNDQSELRGFKKI